MFFRVLRLRRFAYALRAVRRRIPRRVPLRRRARVLRRLDRVLRRRARVLRRRRGLRRVDRRLLDRICNAFRRVLRRFVLRLRFVRI